MFVEKITIEHPRKKPSSPFEEQALGDLEFENSNLRKAKDREKERFIRSQMKRWISFTNAARFWLASSREGQLHTVTVGGQGTRDTEGGKEDGDFFHQTAKISLDERKRAKMELEWNFFFSFCSYFEPNHCRFFLSRCCFVSCAWEWDTWLNFLLVRLLQRDDDKNVINPCGVRYRRLAWVVLYICILWVQVEVLVMWDEKKVPVDTRGGSTFAVVYRRI